VLVRDFSSYAVTLQGHPSSTEAQQAWALGHIRKPVGDTDRSLQVWDQVERYAGVYEMRP